MGEKKVKYAFVLKSHLTRFSIPKFRKSILHHKIRYMQQNPSPSFDRHVIE